ncbi:MAG: T9SS type A sorting domain-containing protein [Bacteroidetes bacterium]|nr:T9SS type A sorting domain-containing protein [Bacteroidota bacterium]
MIGILIQFPKCVSSQGYMGKNKVFLIGQVVNELNGAPIKGHKLIIEADSTHEPSFNYYKVVYTDDEGYYYDTIQTYNLKGSLIVSTNDYQNITYDTTIFYRFNWSEDNIIFANFALPTAPIPVIYQANFYYVRNPNGNNEQEYKFIDITNSQDIISYEWDFGDGTISHEQNPTHIFASPGLNRVSLKVEIQSSPTSKPYISNLVKVINVTFTNYFHMGGHVFTGYFPIDIGHAYLYKIENNELILIDTAIFNDSLGFYLFYQLIEGDYLVKADLDPSSEFFNVFMCTYYGNKLHWTEADTIHHQSTSFEYDINLMPNEKSMAGPGLLAGNINYVSGGDEIISPAENISIILYDSDNNAIDICHSNENGQFELEDLDMNIYYLFAEVTGKYTVPLYVELNGTNTSVTKIEFAINENTVTGTIGYASVHENDFDLSFDHVYPNPVHNFAKIDHHLQDGSQLQVSIIDASGRTVYTKNIENQPFNESIRIPVSSIPPGIYFMRISGKDGIVTRKFIK